MLLYFCIILGAVLILQVLDCTFAIEALSISPIGLLGVTFLAIFVSFCLDGIAALTIRSLPKGKVNPFSKFFCERKGERKFYEKIGVRGWKDLIPESGKYLCHFAKDKIAKPKDNVYILKFLRETCYAEIMHIISIPLAFVPIFFLPYSLTIFLPVAVVNAFLQILPVIVQRYNRIRLITLYNFNERHKRNVKNEQSEEVCADACAN